MAVWPVATATKPHGNNLHAAYADSNAAVEYVFVVAPLKIRLARVLAGFSCAASTGKTFQVFFMGCPVRGITWLPLSLSLSHCKHRRFCLLISSCVLFEWCHQSTLKFQSNRFICVRPAAPSAVAQRLCPFFLSLSQRTTLELSILALHLLFIDCKWFVEIILRQLCRTRTILMMIFVDKQKWLFAPQELMVSWNSGAIHVFVRISKANNCQIWPCTICNFVCGVCHFARNQTEITKRALNSISVSNQCGFLQTGKRPKRNAPFAACVHVQCASL